MSYVVESRWADSEEDPSPARLKQIIASLDDEHPEHENPSLTHDTGWTLTAEPNGLLFWANETLSEAPRYLRNVSRAEVLRLWNALAAGELETVHAELWVSGPPPRLSRAARKEATAFDRHANRLFWAFTGFILLLIALALIILSAPGARLLSGPVFGLIGLLVLGTALTAFVRTAASGGQFGRAKRVARASGVLALTISILSVVAAVAAVTLLLSSGAPVTSDERVYLFAEPFACIFCGFFIALPAFALFALGALHAARAEAAPRD